MGLDALGDAHEDVHGLLVLSGHVRMHVQIDKT